MLFILVNKIKQLLAANKMRPAIDLLLLSTTGDANNDCISLSSRLSAYEDEYNAGTLTTEESDRKRNVLHQAILGTLEKFDEKEVHYVEKIEHISSETLPKQQTDSFVPLPATQITPIFYAEKHFSEIQPLIQKGLVLLVTATETETTHLHQKMRSLPNEKGLIEVKKDNATYYIGLFGNFAVVNVECGTMGATTSMGSTITVINAINALKPKFVLMVGIAFGTDCEKQNIGDVLVSDKLIPYEIQRVSANKIMWRGSKPEANNNLRNSFKSISRAWDSKLPNGKTATLELTDVLTGEKLVDNIDYRNELLEQFPTAKGGEMEGAGLYAACQDKSLPWILVKSICDFADGQKREGKKEKQALAIEMVLRACLAVFNKKFVFENLGVNRYEVFDVKKELTTPKSLINLLNQDQIPELFSELNAVNVTDKYSFNRLKKEYQAGLRGIDLIDWKDRMTVFIHSLNITV
jgi:nucleoside phosphorylase